LKTEPRERPPLVQAEAIGLAGLILEPAYIELIDEVLAENPELKAGFQYLESSRWETRSGYSVFFPHMALEVSPGMNNMAMDSLTGSRKRVHALDLALNLSWEVDFLGLAAERQRMAERELDILQENFFSNRSYFAGRTLLLLIERNSCEERLMLERERLELMTQLRETTVLRFHNGIATSDEVAYAESRRIMARAAVEMGLSDLAACDRNLEALLGRALEPGDVKGDSLSFPALSLASTSAVDAVLLERVDVRTAMSNLDNAKSLEKIAIKSALPSLSLSGRISKRFFTNETGMDEVPDWAISGSLYWPLFAGGRNFHQLKAEKNRQRGAAAEYENILLHARKEIEGLVAEEKQLEGQEVLLKQALIESEKNRDMSRKAYTSGLLTSRDYINVQEEVLDIRLRILEIQTARNSSRVNLALAMGAKWR